MAHDVVEEEGECMVGLPVSWVEQVKLGVVCFVQVGGPYLVIQIIHTLCSATQIHARMNLRG